MIVDPSGSPAIGHDLHAFDNALGLRDPPALRVIQPVAAVPPYDPANQPMVDKAGETTLDVEWSHAIAPGANILLVETPVAETAAGCGFAQMMAAETATNDNGVSGVTRGGHFWTGYHDSSPAPRSKAGVRGHRRDRRSVRPRAVAQGAAGADHPGLYVLERRHAIVDVNAGNNTVSFRVTATKIVAVRGYRAARGYDLASGTGTIDAARFVPELARAS